MRIKLGETDRQLLMFCTTPKTVTQIAEHFESSRKSYQWRVQRLVKAGYLEIRSKGEDGNRWSGFTYIKAQKALPKNLEPIKPLGMCILGVWV